MNDFINKTKYTIFALILGFIMGLVVSKPATESVVTKVEYVTVDRLDTLYLDKPVVVYKDKIINRETIKIDSVYKDFKPSDYRYTLDTINSKFEAHLAGWGGLDKVNIISKHKDSIITKTTTKTLLVNKNALYIWGGYNTRPSYQVGVDYTIRNKLVIGSNIDYDKDTQQVTPGVKIGIKIK